MFSIRKEKNWTLAVLGKNWRTPTRKIYRKSRPRNQTLLKPYEKAGPKQKRILKGRNNLAYVAFRDLPDSRRISLVNKPSLSKSGKTQGWQIWQGTFFRGSKSIENRHRFCTIPLVDLEEEIIDKDFTQSYWLALQFWVQPNRFFTGIKRKKKK